jgi:hypothetical protein
MDQKTFSIVAGVIFTLVALFHLVRIYMGWLVMIGDWSVPMWVSWIGLVVPGGLAFFGLSLQNAMHAETSRAASVRRPRHQPERSRQIARPPSHEIAKSSSLLP